MFNLQHNIYTRRWNSEVKVDALRCRWLRRFILGKLSHKCRRSKDPKSDASAVVTSAKLYWHQRRKPLHSITCISKNRVGTKPGSTNCKNVSVQNIESYTICPRVLTQNKRLWIIKMVWNTFENKFHKRIRAMFTLEPILYHKKNTQLLALTWASRWINSNFLWSRNPPIQKGTSIPKTHHCSRVSYIQRQCTSV